MSVGHVARLLEAAEIATVIIAVKSFQPALSKMALPRVLITPHLMGRPVGPPGDLDRQEAVVVAALSLLDQASENGALQEFPGGYRIEPD